MATATADAFDELLWQVDGAHAPVTLPACDPAYSNALPYSKIPGRNWYVSVMLRQPISGPAALVKDAVGVLTAP